MEVGGYLSLKEQGTLFVCFFVCDIEISQIMVLCVMHLVWFKSP
jgi:hypothetical protein